MIKPTTREEFLSLPTGSVFNYITITYSEEDKKNGYILFNNEKIKINPNVSKMSIPHFNMMCHFDEENDIIQVTDNEGEVWVLGRYLDKSWFRYHKWY